MKKNEIKNEVKTELKSELKKHAATIHCSNTLSLLQRKISNALLYHAYRELLEKDEHEISIKQLCRLIGYAGNNHAVIKEALKALISTVIEWNLISDETGQENWTASSMIASVSLEGPHCYYAYSARMKKLLYSPSMFGKIDLVIQSHFRSSYGLALYENCIRYHGLPYTKWLEMDVFKKLMGVPQNLYPVFRDFKRRVLDKAINEVNTYSDLVISPDFIKEGRRVAKIRFMLKGRAKKTRIGENVALALTEDSSPDPLIVKLQELGISADSTEQLITDYGRSFLQEKLLVMEASSPYQQGKIKNLAAYFISTVKNNYQLPKSQVVAVNKPPVLFDELTLSALQQNAEEIRKQYNLYRERAITESIESLAAEEKESFMRQFLQQVEPAIQTILSLQRSRYTRDNVLSSPQMKAMLRQYAKEELNLLWLLSLDEFVNQLHETKRHAWNQLKAHDPSHSVFRVAE